MSASETELERFGYGREMAHRLVYFSRAVPPGTDFGVGYMLGEHIAGVVDDQTSDPAELAWLIEILGDCVAVLASALREDHLAKPDAQ